MIAIGVALLLLLAAVGGVAFGLSTITKSKRVEAAATYTITLRPTETQEDQGVAFWTVGQAVLRADCGAGYSDPANPGRISMGWGGGVTNNGPGPIGIVSQRLGEIEEPPYLILGGHISWLEEGQEIDAGPSGPGQVINETNYPGPEGAIGAFGILKEGGSSASGTWAWSARVVDPTPGTPFDEIAICVFSLQMKG